MSVSNTIPRFQVLQVVMRLPKHPNRERELEVRVRDGTSFVENAFNGFLWP